MDKVFKLHFTGNVNAAIFYEKIKNRLKFSKLSAITSKLKGKAPRDLQ